MKLDKTKAMVMTLRITFPLKVVDQFKFRGVYSDKHFDFQSQHGLLHYNVSTYVRKYIWLTSSPKIMNIITIHN